MMRWAVWLWQVTAGAMIGAWLMILVAGIGTPQHLALVLLLIQIPVLIADVIVTVRLRRDIRLSQRRWNDAAARVQKEQRKRWQSN